MGFFAFKGHLLSFKYDAFDFLNLVAMLIMWVTREGMMKGDKKSKAKRLSKLLLKIIPFVIAIGSAVAALTPNKSDDAVISIINEIADIAGLNVGHASPEAHQDGVVDSDE